MVRFAEASTDTPLIVDGVRRFVELKVGLIKGMPTMRAALIADGTDEILRQSIARELLRQGANF